MVPLSPVSLLLKPPPSVGMAPRYDASAGPLTDGTPGGFVSRTKLCAALQADTLPATSWSCARQ